MQGMAHFSHRVRGSANYSRSKPGPGRRQGVLFIGCPGLGPMAIHIRHAVRRMAASEKGNAVNNEQTSATQVQAPVAEPATAEPEREAAPIAPQAISPAAPAPVVIRAWR